MSEWIEEVGPIVTARCCKDWPVSPLHPIGKCGVCGKTPKVIHE